MSPSGLRGFAERVAVVTDGSSEIGRAVALQLALQGCYVVVGYAVTSGETERALVELRSIGTLADAVQADVGTSAGVETLFAKAEADYARLDFLVNTAHFKPNKSLLETSDGVLEQTINRNFKTTFRAIQRAVPLMRSRPTAVVVNLAGKTNFAGSSADSAFAAMQDAIIGLTKSLARELAPKIRVNCVAAKGSGETSEQSSINKSFSNQQNDASALLKSQRTVAADDVARAVLYFLSSEAAAVTGQVLTVGEKRRML